MSGIWGSNVRYSIFGESHGKAIGVVIDGIPAGKKLDIDEIKLEMSRRAPGKDEFSTPRIEKDEFEIISGYFNEKTTGAPLCIMIKNTNRKSDDYDLMKDIIRPGHADYTGRIKFMSFNDFRGGGHFSGRLTAVLVFAGAIAKQLLAEKNIIIGSHIYGIGAVRDEPFDKVNVDVKLLGELKKSRFPTINDKSAHSMQELIRLAKKELDSVGGIIEAAIINMPAGVGSPFFDSVESVLSQLLFSIPAVKGVEFGTGFEISSMKGSQANDPFYIKDGFIKTSSNNNGGILGGIANGMPIIFRAALKPTPSIGKQQSTVNMETGENVQISISGRHDPCIVPRAVPVVEAAAAMAVLELIGRV